MPLKIPSEIRAAAIRDWLRGKARDTIAYDNSLSTGSVSSTIEAWRNALGLSDADALRELGIMIRKSGISAPECATGFRLASILKELGVNEELFGRFVSEIYNGCKDIGIQPQYIAYNSKQLLDLAGTMHLSEIPNYIQEKTKEKRKLEEDISKLEQKALEATASLQTALHEKEVYLDELEQFSNLKVELDKLGLSTTEDIQRTVRTINSARNLGHNVDKIVMALSNWQSFGALQAELQKSIAALTVDKNNIQTEYDRLSELVSNHQLKLSVYDQLRRMGCGLKELKWLFGTIKEVAAENNITPDLAVRKFFKDIEEDYDTKLGFDSKLKDLKSEIDKTNNELIIVQKNLAHKEQVAKALGELILMGLDDKQILNFAWTLQSNTNNKESLEADLKRYGSLNNAIEVLNQKLRDLENQMKPTEVASTNIV